MESHALSPPSAFPILEERRLVSPARSSSFQQRTAQGAGSRYGMNRGERPRSFQDSLDISGEKWEERGKATQREVLLSAPSFGGTSRSAAHRDRASVLKVRPGRPPANHWLRADRRQGRRGWMGTPAKVPTCPAVPRTFQVLVLKVLHPRNPSIRGKPGTWVTLTPADVAGPEPRSVCLEVPHFTA